MAKSAATRRRDQIRRDLADQIKNANRRRPVRAKLSSDLIAALPEATKPYRVNDTEITGLALRVQGLAPKLKAYYEIRAKTREGKAVEYKLADVATPIDDVRARAKADLGKIAMGDHPLAEIRERRASVTIADMVRRYIDEPSPRAKVGRRSPTTTRNYERDLERHIAPALGSKLARDLTVLDVDAFLDRVERTAQRERKDYTGGTQANRVRSLLRSAFNMAMRKDMVPTGIRNPVSGSTYRPEEGRRDRLLLQPYELRPYLIGLAEASAEARTRASLRGCAALYLCLFRGLRSGGALALRWEDVDLDATPPRAVTRTKGKTVALNLAADSAALLAEVRTFTPTSAYVFQGSGPRSTKGAQRARRVDGADAPLSETALRSPNRKAIERAESHATAAEFDKLRQITPHWLRHMFQDTFASFNSDEFEQKIAMGHGPATITERYRARTAGDIDSLERVSGFFLELSPRPDFAALGRKLNWVR